MPARQGIEITALKVLTNHHTQQVEIYVEHEEEWKLVCEPGILLPDQTVDFCVHRMGLLDRIGMNPGGIRDTRGRKRHMRK